LLVIQSRDILLIYAELCGKEGSRMQLLVPTPTVVKTAAEPARPTYLFVPRT
jgi:hypothetical protein